ncbi:SnoaL-like domain-containing protein [Pendulispora albinea]|uniref:Nuclear transport factor 2 family protein n=1 Tax=Pendulispora albinea TaxID=2741071 RepID=A0ABZ2LMW6_9BACT
MNTRDIAIRFTELCRALKLEEAAEEFWSDDVVSIEPPMMGDMARLEGREAVAAKGKWWAENHEVHAFRVEGPFINGDEFAIRFEMDVTPRGKSRVVTTEIALYTVRGGKIVEEKYYYGEG